MVDEAKKPEPRHFDPNAENPYFDPGSAWSNHTDEIVSMDDFTTINGVHWLVRTVYVSMDGAERFCPHLYKFKARQTYRYPYETMILRRNFDGTINYQEFEVKAWKTREEAISGHEATFLLLKQTNI